MPAPPSPAARSDPEAAAPDLDAERRHLAESRAALGRMRAKVAGLEAHGGDGVSTEYLKAALWRRMKALEDDPDIPLFFGRLDTVPTDGRAEERFYVGRRHVTDPDGEPMVVDWRADVSRAFYRASPHDPMGMGLRRRFGFQHGELTAYEDEHLEAVEARRPSGVLASAILEGEIERPRVGPMRDIVATIQPDQDLIVRADLSTSICVQGAPGTGKTAVGLHRAAFLLYAHRDQLTRQGVLVIGPNDSFLRYIGDVLPALGEIEAEQLTIEALTARVRVRGVEDAATARLKGDARMATVIRRAVWSHIGTPSEGIVVPRGSRRWRVPAYEAADILAELRERGVRYGAGRAMLAQRVAHAILVKMELAGDSPDDRVQAAVARSQPVRRWVDEVWPKLDPARAVWRLLSDIDLLTESAEGVLTDDEQARLLWDRPGRSSGTTRWTVAEAVLIDEAADIIERTPSVGHVVLDEAQDLSPMMLRAVGRRCTTGSATVLGDLAQATTPWATTSWDDALGHLGKGDAHLEELSQGFRVPSDVIDFAARLLPHIAPDLQPPTSVRRAQGQLSLRPVPDLAAAVVAATREALAGDGSIGVIVPDHLADRVTTSLDRDGIEHVRLGDVHDVEARVDLVPASLAKGLEFDHVVVAEPAEIVAAEPDQTTGLRRLYVCLTRAVTSLAVVHTEPLPEPLR
ncbi:MAG TPA: AAA family ATPase [Nocardioidaceae bacterium]|nr:AAA family ATPase [Nocardioidaceae bacterium]